MSLDGNVGDPALPPPGRFWSAALAFQRGMDRFSDWLGAIASYMVLILVAVGFGNVVLRYLGSFVHRALTSNFAIELQWHLYSLVFLLGFAYILQHEVNVRVDVWYGNWSAKKKALVNLVGHLIGLLPFCVIGILVSWKPIVLSWGLWEQSPDPSGIPRPPIKTMILVSFVFLLLQTLAELVRVVLTLRGREDLVARAAVEEEVHAQ